MMLCPPLPLPFLYKHLQDLGEPDKKQSFVRVFLVPHVTKLLPGTRSVHVCVCVSFGPDSELVTPQYWFATLMLTICYACFPHCQTKRSSSSKHETWTFVLVLWAEDTRSPPFHGQELNSMGSFWKIIAIFLWASYSVMTMDFAAAMSPILPVSLGVVGPESPEIVTANTVTSCWSNPFHRDICKYPDDWMSLVSTGFLHT